jgi:LmbE family N-acetylglucosaminyl deacetylase
MISLLDIRKIKRVLCLGAHCDDIEIGAGGTVMRLITESSAIEFDWVIFGGSDPVRAEEARRAAALFTRGAQRVEVTIHGFRDSFFPWDGAKVKEVFEHLKRSCPPDLILTHHDDDRHQDHRLISELTWNTWRNNMILEYEIFKWDGDLGRPNVFVPLDEAVCRRKAGYLTEAFASQRSRQWFSEDVFQALTRLRGAECNAPSGCAEAFYARKLVL